jgi:predicted Zn-dependent protease
VFRLLRSKTLLIVLVVCGAGVYPAWSWVRAQYVTPWRHYHAAEEALAQRDFGAAYKALDECVKAWPDDPGVRFQAARAARRAAADAEAQGQTQAARALLDEALEHFLACERLLEKQPDANVGDTRLEWALLKAQRGDLLGVEDQLRARLRDDHPDSVLIWEVMSWQLMMNGRLGEARQTLDAWLKREPDNYDALVRQGWVAERFFDVATALEYYQRALAVDAKQDFVRLRVADLLVQGNSAPEALPVLETLRARQPDNPKVLLCWARYYRHTGHADQASVLLDQILARQPRDANALHVRGLLAMDAARPTEAESFFRTAHAIEPGNRLVSYSLSLCLENLGNKEEAKQLRQDIVHMDANIKRLDQLTHDVMKNPHDPALRYEVGMIFLRNGFSEDAVRWLNSALKESLSYQPAHAALADYYERTGNAELAARHRPFLQNSSQNAGRPPAGRAP